MEFGGDRPKDPPKTMVDGTLSAYKKSLGFEAVVASTGKILRLKVIFFALIVRICHQLVMARKGNQKCSKAFQLSPKGSLSSN